MPTVCHTRQNYRAALAGPRCKVVGVLVKVVAAKMRDLAQRSVEAAKEISGLIETSTKQVKEGAQLAQSAGQTIAQTAQTVQQVRVVMGDISGASLEQSAGIDEIN